jgi:putative ABC transport system substrate-binding protein
MRRRIERRELLGMLAGACAAWPSASHAQQRRRLGVLLYSSPEGDANFRSLGRALVDLGYIEGKNVVLEIRAARGQPERLPALAADLVRANPEVLFSLGGDVTVPLAQATRTIPIVFATSNDPVASGLVASLAQPGGNATGVTFLSDDLASKRLEILKEAVPAVRRVAVVWDPAHVDNELREAERAATPLGMQVSRLPLRLANELDAALRAATEQEAEALYVVSSRLMTRLMKNLVDFAAKSRLPLIAGWGAWAQTGALLSFGPNLDEMVRRAATYVDQIFKGSKPADLPVQQPSRFELTVNLRTAKALGLEIAQSLVVRADVVIE